LGNIGTVCTVFKYVSLQKRYPKLLIKLEMDFEAGQKWKTISAEYNYEYCMILLVIHKHCPRLLLIIVTALATPS
jgi:hypothetical protein